MGTANFEGLVTNGTALSVYTFTSAPFGTAHADRHIILGISVRATVFATPVVTIGGVSATVVASTNDTSGDSHTYIAIAAVPTGTTGTIVVTLVASWCACGIYSTIGIASSTPTATAGDIGDPQQSTIDIPDRGLLIGVGSFRDESAITTTGVTERYDETLAGDWIAGGDAIDIAVETARSVIFDGTGFGSGTWAAWHFPAGFTPRDIAHRAQHQGQMAT